MQFLAVKRNQKIIKWNQNKDIYQRFVQADWKQADNFFEHCFWQLFYRR